VQSVHEISLGSIGFRTITLNTDNDDFKLSVNGIPIFCRGACWTPIDPVTLVAEPSQYAHAIQQVRDAGMNMLRISGTMFYESEEFLDLCDSNGILLWQDFMFANMDYPEEEKFVASATTEIRQQLAKLSSRPCLAVLCGNSEVEQQAAMWGATREYWTPRLFHITIADLAKTLAPDVPYWPSSAHGGALPYQGNVGTTSYYGVGAYLRPLEDARRSELKFATECLAFANVPEDQTISKMPRGLALRTHHPEWKARTPRDLGAGWDFEDVRDHYLQQLCGITPTQLRYSDHDRYLALSRVAIGELMAATFGEWRRKDSRCNGAIIWFLHDLWPGAGWGIIDSLGSPKANYYYLRRVLQPVSIAITDEGCNGLFIHLCNERRTEFRGTLTLSVHKTGSQSIVRAERDIAIDADSKVSTPASALLDAFYDLSYAYRFGPPASDYVVATLTSSDQKWMTECIHVRALNEMIQKRDVGFSTSAVASAPGSYALTLKTQALALAVSIEAEGYQCEDQYFNLAPGRERTLVLRSYDNTMTKPFKATVNAINSHRSVSVDVLT
jgi:beta-mannosidase